MSQEPFEPRLVGFLCTWCSYTGADLAGTARMTYPSNLRIIRVMCSGRVDPQFVLKAFEGGSDGVLISGCHPGDCHYGTGNYFARRKLAVARRLLETVGISPDRMYFTWVSAAEGRKFSAVCSEFTERLKQLGGTEKTAAREAVSR